MCAQKVSGFKKLVTDIVGSTGGSKGAIKAKTGWHPWVAHVSSIIHPIQGSLKSQKQLVCSSKFLWGTNVAFIKNVLPLAQFSPLPFFSIWLREKNALTSFSHQVKVSHSGQDGELYIKPHLQHPRLLLPWREEEGTASLSCQWYSEGS